MNQAFSLAEVLWSSDPAAQRAIGVVLGLAAVAALLVFVPLAIRLFKLYGLERDLRALAAEGETPSGSEEYRQRFLESPIADRYVEFERRWKTAQLEEASGRAPIRLLDILEERPLLPFGPRRSLLPALPGLFLAVGVFSALSGLIPSLSESNSQGMSEAARSAWVAGQLGLALRAAAWGFLCAIGASLLGRLIEGAFEARSHGLDEVLEGAFGSVSPGELAELARRDQASSLATLGKDLGNFNNELNDRIDRGLQRIEQSTSRAASLVSQEQRGALNTVVQELSLSIRQGVDQHLSELRAALSRAVEHQTSVTGALAETFEQMALNAKNQDLVARTLGESASSVDEASRNLRGAATEMQPVLEQLNLTHGALEKTATQMGETQTVVAKTVDGVRTSLDAAAGGASDQRQFIELTMSELQRAMGSLESGLGDSVSKSLRDIDDSLAKTVGLLRETLSDSNETIERLASPIRAAEGSARETHLALDRVRGEVEALGQWMSQVAKPLRGGLTDVEGRAEEISRALSEFNSHARQIDKTMEALRHEIREESRRLQGAGSELGRKIAGNAGAVGGGGRPFEPRPAFDAPGSRERKDARDGSGPARASDYGDNPATETDSADDSALDYVPAYRAATTSAATQSTSGGRKEVDPLAPNLGPIQGIDPIPSDDEDERGYRIGVARAKGPDPYARFESNADPEVEVVSNAPPVVEKRFGDDLKLSELLRGRKNHAKDNADSGGKNVKGKKTGKSSGKNKVGADSDRN